MCICAEFGSRELTGLRSLYYLVTWCAPISNPIVAGWFSGVFGYLCLFIHVHASRTDVFSCNIIVHSVQSEAAENGTVPKAACLACCQNVYDIPGIVLCCTVYLTYEVVLIKMCTFFYR